MDITNFKIQKCTCTGAPPTEKTTLLQAIANFKINQNPTYTINNINITPFSCCKIGFFTAPCTFKPITNSWYNPVNLNLKLNNTILLQKNATITCIKGGLLTTT